MKLNIEQQVIEIMRNLPLEKQREVLQYVEKLSEPPAKEVPKYLRQIRERMAKLPEDAWDGVPTDGSLNVNHHLYGAPKK